jgi:hypothetical protein
MGTMLHGKGDASGGNDNVEMLSTHKKVPAYRCDMSFMLCDKRMCCVNLPFGD